MSKLDNISDDEYHRFYEALKFSMKWEGGYTNDPDDPGGETKWGISKRAHPEEDIPNLSAERAAEIYYDDYWLPSGASELPLPFCTVVFDTAVLCGVNRAVQWLRDAEGQYPEFLASRRQLHLTRAASMPSQKKFLKGWINRVNDLQKYVELYGQ